MKTIILMLCLTVGLTSLTTTPVPTPAPTAAKVSFTLLNTSIKSIPLKIPGVMNPNLSPMSSSGVTLSVGQKVYFSSGWKKHLLLEVTTDLQNKKLKVNQLIKKRKKELGL